MPTISKQEAILRGLKKNTWQLHTILIPISDSLINARVWLKDHGYYVKWHRITENFHRFNQNVPAVRGAEYRTQMLPNGVELVYLRF